MSWASGQEIGPYRLLRRLGRGGFAEVWLAELSSGTGFRRRLALKLVQSEAVSGSGVRAEALLREARFTSWLQAPNIVSVERVSVEDGAPVLAMEYCDAGTMTELMRRLRVAGLPMPPSLAVDVGIHVARALHVAHNAIDPDGAPVCIVHRDLKPSNVLLTRSGLAKVCDFGIAKAEGEADATGTGVLKGTTAYIAPELWEDVHAYSPASDMFALGTLLVEMTTLQQLHGGASMAVVYRRIAEGDATDDALRVAPFLPPLVPLLEELLRRDPSQRLAEARVVEERLVGIREELPGSVDLILALDLLERAEGKSVERPLRSLPPAVDRAWQALVERATGQALPLVPGPSGAADLWELAVAPPRDGDVGLTGLLLPEESGRAAAESSAADGPSQPSSPSQSGRRVRRRRRKKRGALWPALIGVGLALVLGVGIGSLGMLMLARSSGDGDGSAEADATSRPRPTATVSPSPIPHPAETPTPTPRLASSPESVPSLDPSPTAEQASPPAPSARPDPEIPAPKPSEPEETPAPEATEPPAAPLPGPCLAVTSRPPGAYVWINGALQSGRARSQPSMVRRMSPGRFVVSMALVQDGDRSTADVSLDKGEVKVVRCELLGSGGSCRVTSSESDVCGD
jgi:eukaryotic-like serine/threonine-protein kinase